MYENYFDSAAAKQSDQSVWTFLDVSEKCMQNIYLSINLSIKEHIFYAAQSLFILDGTAEVVLSDEVVFPASTNEICILKNKSVFFFSYSMVSC